jgi:hypothetical protein
VLNLLVSLVITVDSAHLMMPVLLVSLVTLVQQVSFLVLVQLMSKVMLAVLPF